MVGIDLDGILEDADSPPRHARQLFDMDDASYPTSEEAEVSEHNQRSSSFTVSRVYLEDGGSEPDVTFDFSDDEATLDNTVPPLEQRIPPNTEKPDVEKRAPVLIGLGALIAVVAVILLVISVTSGSSDSGSSDAFDNEQDYCRICPEGFVLSTPNAILDPATTVPMFQSMTCQQIENNSRAGMYNSSIFCSLVQSQTGNACDCMKVTSPPNSVPQSPSAPIGAPVNPTPAPIAPPTAFLPAPIPPSAPFAPSTLNRNFDRFSYGETRAVITHNEFGPKDWGRISCPDRTTCLGWPDKWEYARGWRPTRNYCRWCPENGSRCGTHHQSPIDLRRRLAVEGSGIYNECIDVHLMAFRDSSCSFDALRNTRSFKVDRHALRILQPIYWSNSRRRYALNCRNEQGGSAFGRIDYSRGFSNWWFLSHTDFHLPSEHTQDGKRYDAELQMYHFYSVTGEAAGVDNEMGTVSVFLEAFDDVPDYTMLNEVICAWREDEEKTRSNCGLPSITTPYDGCPNYASSGSSRRRATEDESPEKRLSVNDILIQNIFQQNVDPSYQPKMVDLTEDMLEHDHEHRDLLFNAESNSTKWNNYFALNDAKTEYYYRYSGTQTIPPCYGTFVDGNNRRQTNHWRVMKDPIRVSRRQINEMHRLMRERIAPRDDQTASCQRDTAATIDSSGRVNTARPLQKSNQAHFAVFCECNDWRSAFPEDKEWCKMNKYQRFFEKPYNFPSDSL